MRPSTERHDSTARRSRGDDQQRSHCQARARLANRIGVPTTPRRVSPTTTRSGLRQTMARPTGSCCPRMRCLARVASARAASRSGHGPRRAGAGNVLRATAQQAASACNCRRDQRSAGSAGRAREASCFGRAPAERSAPGGAPAARSARSPSRADSRVRRRESSPSCRSPGAPARDSGTSSRRDCRRRRRSRRAPAAAAATCRPAVVAIRACHCA